MDPFELIFWLVVVLALVVALSGIAYVVLRALGARP